MSQSIRKRPGKKGSSATASLNECADEADEVVKTSKMSSNSRYYIGLCLVTLFAFYTRFNKIWIPDRVVFDEVHFGKFASYYLERTYFFDLHPPFAKLLIALVGYLVGFDGKFKFDNINDLYTENHVPYVALRSLLALQSSITVPVVYLTLMTLGYSVPACFFASILVCFDTAHVSEGRLILLDATLILSVALSYFCYVKFSTYRNQPFSKKWWKWLTLTGVSLSCVISTKYVGVFTFISIGVAVMHELWTLLDYRKGLTMRQFWKHFLARFLTLIVIPFLIFLFWFYLHFAILNKSGPGDSFMSSDFQETLKESPMAKEAKEVQYNDIITIKHKDTEAFLHSHELVYPLRYEDGRISSNTQQVTCVFDPKDCDPQDPLNQWEVLPAKGVDARGKPVYTNDIVRFRHIGTGGYLLTHDVASPLKPTNEEFTIFFEEDDPENSKYNDTLFRLRLSESGSNNKGKRKIIRTKATPLKVLHVNTMVAMWTHDDELLPEWGLNHQEVNGNKKIQDKENVWVFDTITNMPPDDKRAVYVPRQTKKMPFLKKWYELQGLMFHHNNILTSEHPFATLPETWPLALNGVSFWNDNTERKQIFFTGNVIGFWIEVCFLAFYVGILLADQVSRRRNMHILSHKALSRLYNTLSFFFIGWCAHYFPFYLMNRQRFLHHYLPAHLIAAMFSGALVEFLCSNNSKLKSNYPRKFTEIKLNILVAILSAVVIWFFWFFSPLVYGDISLTPEQVQKRLWLDIKLHYSK